MVITNILIPLDGSPLAEAALPFAEVLASRTRARLTLIRATRDTIEQSEQYLRTIAAPLEARGLLVNTGVPFRGHPADWIVEEADFRQADLIIMATHDRVGPDRWLHGSVAEAVVHAAPVPVMLVRGIDAPALAQRFVGHQPVLILPLDGSHLAEAAVPATRALARAIDARVIAVGVLPSAGQMIAGVAGAIIPYDQADNARLELEARGYMADSVAQLIATGTPVEIVVRHGEPPVEIATLANETSAAAIVMASHGRTGLLRSVVGSVAGGVLHYSQTPVVVVHAPALRGAEQPATELAAPAGA